MRWPWQPDRDTDLRIYRDPKTGEPTLKMQGGLDLTVVTFDVTLHTKVTRDVALRLRDQINAIFDPPE
jgi:hypothetical protein